MYNCINFIITYTINLFFHKESETTNDIVIVNLPEVQHYYDLNVPTDKLHIRNHI